MLKRLINFIAVSVFTLIGFSCDEPIEFPSPDLTPPNAYFVSPFDGDLVSGLSSIQVRSVDNEGMKCVVFYINQIEVFTDSFPDGDNYVYQWETTDYEEDVFHQVSFIAIDINENKYASYSIRVKTDNVDNEKPVATIISPFNNQVLSESFNIIVNATDNDSIQFVSFFIDNILIGNEFLPTCTDETSPTTGDTIQSCYFIFENVSTALIGGNGIHSIHAVVRDMNNNASTLSPIIVNIINDIDTTPPSGSIISPATGMEVSGMQIIEVQALDNDSIQVLKLLVNSELIQIINHNAFDQFNSIGTYYFDWNTETALEDQENIISVEIQDRSGNISILYPITLIVNNEAPNDIEPPMVAIVSPSAGETISGETEIKVLATDNYGIAFVEFFIDGINSYTDSIESDGFFNYTWDTDSLEEDTDHYIAARAFDLSMQSTFSSQITIHLDNFDNIPPNGYIQSPAPGQVLAETVVIDVFAEDNFGIERVVLFINGDSAASLNTSPYSYLWDTVNEAFEDEEILIYAIITDLSGNTFSTIPIMVTVDNILPDDTTYPTGSISAPISGQTISGTVSFNVNAQDNIGVAEVNFFINEVSVSLDNSAPYEYEWETGNSGEYILSATITDLSENTTFLQPILITVDND